MAPQAYKVVRTHAYEISEWTIISRILHSRAPHLGGMNGDVKSDLATLEFNNGEQLGNFNILTLRLQQEIILSGETESPTIFKFHYMKALSKTNKLKAFIEPKMTDLIKFLDNKGKSSVYTGGNIHGLYRYL